LANPDAIADIQALYRKTDDEEVRRYALVAMASTRARGSESYFLEALSSEDHASRILGLAVLRNFGSRDQADAITEHALLDGSRIFRQDADALLLEAQSTIASLELLNEYLRTVIKLDPQAGESLYLQAAAVKSVPRSSSAAQQLYQIRWQAIYGLGYTGAEQAAEIVATALKDPDPRIRAVALRSLGVLGNAKYHDSIVAMLNDRSAEVRWMAARVLGRSGVESASETLIRSLADTNAQVRLESALALGYLNAAAAKMKLSELASKDPDSRVQEAALYAASLIK
jgi:HEAT repeat protein